MRWGVRRVGGDYYGGGRGWGWERGAWTHVCTHIFYIFVHVYIYIYIYTYIGVGSLRSAPQTPLGLRCYRLRSGMEDLGLGVPYTLHPKLGSEFRVKTGQ